MQIRNFFEFYQGIITINLTFQCFWLAFKSCIFHGHIQLLYLLLTISPGMPQIYSIKFLVVNFFGVEFPMSKSGNCENQSLLEPVKIWSIINRGFVTSWQPSFMPVQIAVLRIPAQSFYRQYLYRYLISKVTLFSYN